MDGREAMAMSGTAAYYMHRGLTGSSGPGSQPGLHGPPGIRSLSNPNQGLSSPSSNIGGGSGCSAFQMDSPSSISQHGNNVGGPGLMPPVEPVKRKRGRPRKYGPDGSVSLALSPISPTQGSGSGLGVGSGSGAIVPFQKRGRGRPPGTGKKQQLASFGEWISESAGMGFTPHIITIPVGEDIATKIMSFSQLGPRAIVILSANGAVSTVTLRQPAISGGTVTYEGRFEILCLSGSYLLTDNGGSRSRSGGLSISLSSPDGRVIGGGVGGMLIAASPVQVMVGSFIFGGTKKNKSKTGPESTPDAYPPSSDKPQTTPSSITPSSQNLTSPVLSGWPGPRQMDIRNAHIEIDLTRG